MNVRTLYQALCEAFPEETRASFDLDGLQLCPEEGREIRHIVTALDVTRESVEEAKRRGAELLVTHHPILFSAVRTLDPCSSMDAQNATELLKSGIALISLHTRFDAACGGINDTLCKKLTLENVRPFGLTDDPIPLGRVGYLPEALSAEEFANKVTLALDTHVLLTTAARPIKSVAVVGGAAGDYLDAWVNTDVDALLTGEVAHHRRLLASHAGKVLAEAGHWGTEHVFCEAIAPFLKKLVPSAEITAFLQTPHEVCVP